ncbi:DUF3817 domain-containing protein [Arthrobacter sp. JSM 101049]|uniref:DUF3817 domain-containing protein n=1 Tax=Arthrobacter sp. JSM 101049 TaxID=929097 RepID=UPI003566A5C6
MPSTADPRTAARLTPKRLYGLLATAEMFTWGLLLLGMALKYGHVSDAFVPVFGGVHGLVFLSYCVVTCFVWVNQRWGLGRGLAGLASAFIPFCTVPFERSTDKAGLLEGGWRLGPDGDRPRGFIETVQAWCLRHPFPALILGLLFVAVVFSVLLILGPPVPRS